MSNKNNNKHTDIEKEALRLEYCFEKGINLRDRIIQITGEIQCGSSFDWLDAALTEMEQTSRKSITIKINSPGGSVYEALAMMDRIKDSKCKIITKCYGHAMSAAGLILVAGDRRLIGSNSWFMYHEISHGMSGTISEMEEELLQSRREMNQWALSMSLHTKESAEFWEDVAAKTDYYLNANECLQSGIVDAVF